MRFLIPLLFLLLLFPAARAQQPEAPLPAAPQPRSAPPASPSDPLDPPAIPSPSNAGSRSASSASCPTSAVSPAGPNPILPAFATTSSSPPTRPLTIPHSSSSASPRSTAEGMNEHPVFGKGLAGFYGYTWRGFLDKSDGTYLSAWLLPSLLHEDTRYYALGAGHSMPPAPSTSSAARPSRARTAAGPPPTSPASAQSHHPIRLPLLLPAPAPPPLESSPASSATPSCATSCSPPSASSTPISPPTTSANTAPKPPASPRSPRAIRQFPAH